MSLLAPVIVVEDDQHLIRYMPDELGELLGRAVIAVETLGELAVEMERLNADPTLRGPVVLLDPGLPGICRFQTIPLAVERFHRAHIIQWTSNRSIPTHTGALIDGAMASLEKSRTSMPVAAEVVNWVANGRRWCEPDQAQWFVELLDCLAWHKQESKDSVWKMTQLDRLPDASVYIDELLDLANGGPMPADDTWFTDLLVMLRRYWLTPSLRRSRTALVLYATQSEASAAIEKTHRAIGGDATRLIGRLMPRRAGEYAASNMRDNAIIRTLVREHNPCELRDEDHDLSREAFGLKAIE